MENGTQKYIETVGYLGKLYDFANKTFFESALSKPVITIQRDEKNKTNGWFSVSKVWHENSEDEGENEINMTAQALCRPVNEIFSTLVHEMCHQYAQVHGIKDCSRGNVYHNKQFKQIAENHGLTVECVKGIGWSHTSLTDDAASRLEKFTAENPPAIIYRNPVSKGQTVKTSSTRKYVCPACGMSVRATKEVKIMCVDCNELMTEE